MKKKMTRPPVPMLDDEWAALLRSSGVVDDRPDPVVLPDRGAGWAWCATCRRTVLAPVKWSR
jgi:hypothetical protein